MLKQKPKIRKNQQNETKKRWENDSKDELFKSDRNTLFSYHALAPCVSHCSLDMWHFIVFPFVERRPLFLRCRITLHGKKDSSYYLSLTHQCTAPLPLFCNGWFAFFLSLSHALRVCCKIQNSRKESTRHKLNFGHAQWKVAKGALFHSIWYKNVGTEMFSYVTQ